MGVEDDLPDATLFQVEVASKWAKHIVRLLSIDFQANPKDVNIVENTMNSI